jgi:predicted TIM-barrel fold metal-dependent hydrolase
LPIIDSQVHLAGPGESTWVDLPESGLDNARRTAEFNDFTLRRDPDAADLIREMDCAGVDGAVLVPPARGGDIQKSNLDCIEAARNPHGRFVVMARLREDRPQDQKAVEEMQRLPEVRGLRVTFLPRFNPRAEELLRDRGADWIWSLAERLDLPVMVFAPRLTKELTTVVERHPDLRIAIDHLGIDVDQRSDDIEELIRPVLAMSTYSNVAVKASALPFNINEDYPFPSLKEALRRVTAVFGAGRVFWGSDISRLPCRYGQWVRFFSEELDFLTEEERRDILGAGIARWLGWSELLSGPK